MKSKWSDKKTLAIKLRKRGHSIRNIEMRLGIRRSTLSEWFRNVVLTAQQKEALDLKWRAALVRARVEAARWHHEQKANRLAVAAKDAEAVLKKLNFSDENLRDLALAMLYLGEGNKSADETGMGNSDPLILKTFLYILRKNYNIDLRRIRCELYLRADQDAEEMKIFWAKQLGLQLSNFKYAHFDRRTLGRPTFPKYKGVCMVRYGDVAIKRKLMHISKCFCERLIVARV